MTKKHSLLHSDHNCVWCDKCQRLWPKYYFIENDPLCEYDFRDYLQQPFPDQLNKVEK
jgi:hypothetical protein